MDSVNTFFVIFGKKVSEFYVTVLPAFPWKQVAGNRQQERVNPPAAQRGADTSGKRRCALTDIPAAYCLLPIAS